MEHIDVMTGETTWHHAIIENAGRYPEDDRERFLYELRALYLAVHHKDFSILHKRPDIEKFKTDPEYAWLREIELPSDIFY